MEPTFDPVERLICKYYPLSEKGRAIMRELLVRKELSKGETFIKEGHISQYISFIEKGMVRQFYYKHGKDLTEHFAYEGCMFMCIESFLKQVPTRLMVEALEPVVIWGLPHHQLQQAIVEHKEIEFCYRKILEHSLLMSQVKADSWRFETAQERYILLMKQHPQVIMRAPLAHIASYLLMTPETLSRVRAQVVS